MNERVSSVLVKGLNYDFEFNENTLSKQDMSLETDIYTIKVFGNDYLIGMGSIMTHPNNEELYYFIAYLIYNKKVVCKIGIYELLKEDNQEEEELNHRTVDFSSLRLIVDNRYYEEPKILESYVSTIEDVDDSEEEKEEEQKEEQKEEQEEGEEQKEEEQEEGEGEETKQELEKVFKTAGVEESKGNDIGEIDYKNDTSNFVPFLTDLFMNMNTIEEYKSSRLRNILVGYRKNILPLISDKKEQKKRRQTIYKLFQKIFPEVTSEFNPSIIINDDETFLSTTFNPDILLTAEYYLNVKVIINNVESFSIYGSLTNTETLTSLDKLKENILFANFDPKSILYLNVEDGVITSTVLKKLDELNDAEIQTLKQLLYKNDHEFVFDTQLKSIKQLVS